MTDGGTDANNRLARASGFWKRHWFLLSLAVVVALGFLTPDAADTLRRSELLPFLVATTLFISGWLLDTSRLVGGGFAKRAVVAGLVSTYAIAPGAAFALGILFSPGEVTPGTAGFEFLEALMIMAAQAGTISSAIALTIAARGSQELAIVLTVLTNGLTAFLTPLVLERTVGRVVEFPTVELMTHMIWVILLPVLGGQIVRRFTRPFAARWQGRIRIVPQAIILVFVYCGFGAAAPHLLVEPLLTVRFLIVAAALHVVLVVWNVATARVLKLDRELRAALIFCGSQKTIPNGIYTWQEFFAHNPYGAVPLALYHVLQLVVGAFLVPWLATGNSTKLAARDE